MKRVLMILTILAVAALACNLPLSATPIPTPVPETSPSTATPVPTTDAPDNPTAAPEVTGIPVVFDRLSLTLPAGMATGGTGAQFPRAEGDMVAPWEVTPGHIQLTLDGYALKNTFHQPRIFVYPAQEYAELNNGAAESIKRLQEISANPGAAPTAEALPFVPFFNAGAQFTSQSQVIEFQNGLGVRFLTQYGQNFGPITNEELFYHFQGLTSDGKFYVIAILPINHPSLQANFDAPIPAEGIPFPDYSDPNADFAGYYNLVTDMLDLTLAGAFTPHLENLDLLVQSIKINP